MKNTLHTIIDFVIIILYITALVYCLHTGFEKEDRRMDMLEVKVQTLMDAQNKSPDMPDSKLQKLE